MYWCEFAKTNLRFEAIISILIKQKFCKIIALLERVKGTRLSLRLVKEKRKDSPVVRKSFYTKRCNIVVLAMDTKYIVRQENVG